MNKLWKWFDGKKTNIGTIMLIAATVGEEVVTGIWGVDAKAAGKIIETLQWFGVAFGGVGLFHKGAKKTMLAK
jgi:hypothetical protein